MSSFTFFAEKALIGEDLNYMENVFMTIDEGYIEDISKSSKNSKGVVISAPHSLIIPSFINMHVHVGDSFAREKGKNLTLSEIVEPPDGLKHHLLEKTNKDTIIQGMRSAIEEMLRSGTTFFLDFREGGIKGAEILLEALEGFKIKKMMLGRPVNEHEDIFKLMKIVQGLGLSSVNDYTTENLRRFNLFFSEASKIMATHVSEVEKEREKSFTQFNCSDIERAINEFNANLLIHAIHASNEDLDLIKQKDATIVLCPRANSYFNLPMAPVNKFINKKINLCLGTDNVMANSPDLLREMEFFSKRVRSDFGVNLLASKEIIKMVTINATRAMKLDHDLGSLDPLKRADFLVIDTNAPNLLGLDGENVHDFIVHRLKSENISRVYINGNVVHER